MKDVDDRINAKKGILKMPHRQVPGTELLEMAISLANKYGENDRQKTRSQEPLNAIESNRTDVINEVVDKYNKEVSDPDHYIMRSVSLLKEEEMHRRLTIIKKSACKRRGAISNASNAGTDHMSQNNRSRRGTIPNPLASAGVENQFA